MHITLVLLKESNTYCISIYNDTQFRGIMKKLVIIVIVALYISGCVFTKLVTVPLRVSGSLISVVPIVGNQIDEVIGQSADLIDDLPY